MTRTEILPFTQWADISRTGKFVCVQTLSGYRIIQPEDDGYLVYLPPDATDDALGQALLGALDRSRFIWPPTANSAKRIDTCDVIAIGRRIL
jgi:hypothetical protein